MSTSVSVSLAGSAATDDSLASSTEERLGTGSIVRYSLPAIPLGFMGGLVSLYLLKFATDVLLVAPALFAAAFSLAKIWDAVSDPMVGYLSDRTGRSAGRRRPWVIRSIVPVIVGFAALWAPPAALSGSAMSVWICAAVFFYYTAYTVANVPHLAWGAELSRDYHERTRIFGTRGVFDLVGLLLGAGCIGLLQTSADERTTAVWIAAGFALGAGVLMAVGALGTRERAEYSGRGGATPLSAISDVAGNRLARILLAVFFLESLAMSSLAVLFPYVTEYVMTGSGFSAHYIILTLGAALLTFPAWIPLSRRFGKRNPWIAANLLKTVAFAALFFAGPERVWLMLPMAMLIGVGEGCTIILPASIKADVIDVDELETGERKEGAYFAGWNLARKLAGGAAIAITGLFLQFSGYEANAVQSEETQLVIRLLFSAFPFACHVVAIALLLRFDLDEHEHARIRSILDARRQESA